MLQLAASLAGGSVTRALAALGGEEESLRGHVVRWFFEAAAGEVSQEAWLNRETLDEGLETIKMLVRDWIVAAGSDGALLTLDYEERLRGLPPIGKGEAVALLGKLGEAQRLAQTNVMPALVGEYVRMAIGSSLRR